MKRVFLFVLAMVILFTSAGDLRGQNKSGKPFMKITVKDEKVLRAEPLDTGRNSFIIMQGVDQNASVPLSGGEKERPLPERTELAMEVLDSASTSIRYLSPRESGPEVDPVSAGYSPEAGWEVITYETFEGSFPAPGWDCFAASGFADACWDENSYRSYNGSWSMYCADLGTAAVSPPAAYPMDMQAWAVYGPFDLSDATGAELEFMLWLDSESGYDYFQYMVSTDGVNFYGYQTSGNSEGWISQNMDLTAVPTLGDVTGASSVYFALVFESDYSVSFEGAFVDDVLLQKYVEDADGPDLWWSSMALSSSNWIAGNAYTADLTVNNLGAASAGAHYTRIYLSYDDIISEGDIQLGEDLHFGPIDAAGSSTFTAHSFTAPDEPDGIYYVGAIVDVYNDIAETDETNNAGLREGTVSIGGNLPDLTPLSMSLSEDQWEAGNTINSEISEENNGGVNAGAHESMIVLSADNSISTSDVQLGPLISFPVIDAGSSSTITTSWQVPDVAQGIYYLGLIVDVNDDVSESDESNNIGLRNGTIEITGIPEPDIHVTPTSLTIIETDSEQSRLLEQGDSGSLRNNSGLSADGPIIPNQVIVRFKGSGVNNLKGLNATSSDFELFSAKHRVKVLKEMRKPDRQAESVSVSSTLLIQLEHEGTLEEVISELNEMDIVEHAEPNYRLQHDDDLSPEYEPDDPLFPFQWGLKNTGNAIAVSGSPVGSPGSDINATNAWDITTGSSSIVVAVIDDGIDPSHPEFIGKITGGYDFVDDDSDPTSQNGDFHGNACAGIISAADDDQGTIGVAPGVRLMPLRVCNSVDCASSAIIDAIYYAVDNGARVISISLGGGSFSSFMEEAINYAVFHNVVVFASAGNDNEDNTFDPHYPSGYANCISVGAMSPCGERKSPSTCDGETWWGSNYGDLDFITPGTRIYTTDISGSGGYGPDDYLTRFNGTSAACPHAAGVAALILSLDPGLSSLQVRQYMQQGSVDIGAAGYDAQSGYGRLDAYLGLQMVQSGGLDQIIISNQGNADLSISAITDDMTWMNLSHSTVPLVLHAGASMLVEIQVDWELVSASETGHITINSNDPDEGTVVVDVTATPNSVDTYLITAEANPPSGGYVEGTGEKGINQEVILTAYPASTYDFVSWTEDGSLVSTDPVYTFMATRDRHLVANFDLKSFTISASASPSSAGTVSGTGTFDYGELATLTATAAEGYEFTNWTVGGTVVSTHAVYSFTVTEDLTFTANFSTEYYSITASVEPEGAGSVSGTGSYTHNQTVQLHAAAASGYVFDEWTVDGNTVSNEAVYSFAAVADVHLVARFSVQVLNVTALANPEGAGTISGGGSYPYGSLVTLLATASPDYEFVNWTMDDIEVSSNPGYSFNVYQNSIVVANFKPDSSLTIQTSSLPAEGGITAGGGQFDYGDLVILAAVPAQGYQLDYWIDEDDVILSDNNPYAFTAVEDAHIKAVFVPENNTGIAPHAGEHPFELYPNPAGDYLYVKSVRDLNESAFISLYDLNGKAIANYKEVPLDGNVFEMNISRLIPGMYFIRIRTDGGEARFTGKVIKR
jgi:subtilisin family serine protease